MTTDQKQAIMVLMNLYDDNNIDEEQYFLLLDFVISDEREESPSVDDTSLFLPPCVPHGPKAPIVLRDQETMESGICDEKIRKTIIRFFKDQYSNETEMYDGSVTVGKAIAWLEKQGQKPTLRERYENIAQSEWFKRTHEGMSVSDDEESTWTEEDDYNVQCCIAKAESDIANGCPGRNKDLIEWLKSLKPRMEEQQ